MTSREPFNSGLQKSVAQSQPVMQNMRLSFSSDRTAVYKPVNPPSPTYPADVGGVTSSPVQGMNMNMGGGNESMKKKRGRPRKYGSDGAMTSAFVPSPTSASTNQSGGGGFSSPPGGSASPNSLKKAKGRPAGSRKKDQFETLGIYILN